MTFNHVYHIAGSNPAPSSINFKQKNGRKKKLLKERTTMKYDELKKGCVYKLTSEYINWFNTRQSGTFCFVDRNNTLAGEIILTAEKLRFVFKGQLPGDWSEVDLYELDNPNEIYLGHFGVDFPGMIEESPGTICVPVSSEEHNGVCRRCNSQAYIGFNDVVCPQCGRY